MTAFSELRLPESMNRALERMQYATATPVQAEAIPAVMDGSDILASAQTGTGKTAAFAIPMVAALMKDRTAKALVMAPTRELAAQIDTVVRQLAAADRSVRTALLVGGKPMGPQFKQLETGPRILIGTPGRIHDHLARNPALLDEVQFVALDEADRMLDMGFKAQVDRILAKTPAERQTVLFSATFSPAIVQLAETYLRRPRRISIEPEKAIAPKIRHEVVQLRHHEKYGRLVQELDARQGSVIVFTNTKKNAEELAQRLRNDHHEAAAIHGDLAQWQRDKVLNAFRAAQSRVLVATDVAARGLDVPHVAHVVNYDMPQDLDNYEHRIGRTGRNGAEGDAVGFVAPYDIGAWNAINRKLGLGQKLTPPQNGHQHRKHHGRSRMTADQAPTAAAAEREPKARRFG